MPRPRFSEMLVSRRRELNLTIDKASRQLKLREDVLVAFEEGDFERMPQSGYAQGMLASYARYLGLNPRQVTDCFQEDLYAYMNGGASSQELRRRGRGASGREQLADASGRPRAYGDRQVLLPASGGPAGDMGAFSTTADARPRRSVPLAGAGPSAVDAYGTGAFDPRVPAGTYGQRPRTRRPYNSPEAVERVQGGYGRRQGGAARRRSADAEAYGARGFVRDEYRRDDVATRSVRSSDYVDDMRYDDLADPYESASTISGRRGSRNIASMERPRVRRQAPAPSRNRPPQRGRGGRRRKGGLASFFEDPRRAALAIVLVAAIVLIGILFFSVKSCVSSKSTAAEPTKTVTVNSTSQTGGTTSTKQTTTDTPADSSKSTSTSKSSDSSKTDDSKSTADDKSAATYTPTVVHVSVKSGAYTWLEITNDGTSIIAESVTGPWEGEYTVTDSITVSAGDPSSVTVTKNGTNESFTSKASGLGSLSIKGTKPPEDAAGSADGDSADGSDTSGDAAAQSTDGTTSASDSE